MYWEVAGILPKLMFQADFGSHISRIVTIETLKIIRKTKKPILYYLNTRLKEIVLPPPNVRQRVRKLRRNYRFWNTHHYWLPLQWDTTLIRFFDAGVDEDGFPWATSLDEPLYHYRGSLTAAIDLAAILYPQADIKLLGVDMTGYGAFYQMEPLAPDLPRYHRYQSYEMVKQTDHDKKSRQIDAHVTAVERDGKPGVQAVIPMIRQQLQSEGRELYCCNPESLLVTEGICPYTTVID